MEEQKSVGQAPRFCGAPGWPPCVDPPQPAAELNDPHALMRFAWRCYLKGRKEQEEGIPLGELPPWLKKD